MQSAGHSPLIAVDIGNERMKLGRFESPATDEVPEPVDSLSIPGDPPRLEQIEQWLGSSGANRFGWWIGSVNRLSTTRLVDWLRHHRPEEIVTLLAAGDLPLAVEVDRPDMVGIDRLLNAVAANQLRNRGAPAVIVDVGTAITVDLISDRGAFLGGAIFPGIAMSAKAMHQFTDLLPLIDMSELADPPPALGKATVPAMRSGLFWGAVGAVRQLIDRLSHEVSGEPEVFLSGGAGPTVADLLGPRARHVPHLTLAGIALTAWGHLRQDRVS